MQMNDDATEHAQLGVIPLWEWAIGGVLLFSCGALAGGLLTAALLLPR